ncbi:hypothetical protein AB1Y20_006514 [Prymnesium parvum]|uniref:Uncharacterized protein n=1 Tax=Prymnesium parvum TaxID=97485 RepID=A0AB34IYP5_PRYPA
MGSDVRRTRSSTAFLLVLLTLKAGPARASFELKAYVKATNPGDHDYFGFAVAMSGDTLVVGAKDEDSCATGVATTAATDNGCNVAGAAYVYTRSGTAWAFEAYVKAPNTGAEDQFGHAIGT